MATQLRGAIVGVGHVAALGHAPGWQRRADVRIVAGCDPRPERQRELASRFPDVAWHESLDSLLAAEDLDFVDVCTPPAGHGDAIRRALERGLHVLCEKPLVLDPVELDRLAGLARERSLALATVHNWRFAPMLARATELVGSGAIGRILRCRWEVLRDRPSVAVEASGAAANWRLDPRLSGGGILTDHGWHAIYVLAGWIGNPEVASSRLTSAGRPDAISEDTAELELVSAGARAEVFLTWRAGERANRVRIDGDRATLSLEGRTLELRIPGGNGESIQFPEGLSDGSHHPDWFAGVAAAFIDEIRHPERRGRTVAEAAVCLSVILEARRMAEADVPTALGVGSPAGDPS
jgi:predicted dehydrogenase